MKRRPQTLEQTAFGHQAMHRIKVGMTGLAGVLVLIGLAGAVFASANKGNANAQAAHSGIASKTIAANAADTAEPLAELGVAPGGAPDNSATTAKP